jgi:Cys-tRNA synthase (O-phospho-L-seryl-tRNA:Cys-tRNA synthase)
VFCACVRMCVSVRTPPHRVVLPTGRSARGCNTPCSVTGVSQECHKSVIRVSQECHKSVTRVSQECHKSVTRSGRGCNTPCSVRE